jgi:hypothetical protein
VTRVPDQICVENLAARRLRLRARFRVPRQHGLSTSEIGRTSIGNLAAPAKHLKDLARATKRELDLTLVPSLLVVADTAVDVTHSGDEAYLLYGLRLSGPREHVADLSDRALRLLAGVVDFLTKRFPGLVL